MNKKSSRIYFSKMQGLGNDYLYLNNIEHELDNASLVSRVVSDRHFGVGSDGIILICLPTNAQADFRMRIYNSDGSEAESCGNGLRCFGKYIYEKGLTNKTNPVVQTNAGLVYLELALEDGIVRSTRVNMGKPILQSNLIPVALDSEMCVDQNFEIPGFKNKLTSVSMGNPHAVFFVPELSDSLVHGIGPRVEHDKLFPNRVNVEFVKVINRRHLEMRVWERGVGETLACGTGACAVLVAAVLNGLCEREAVISLLGGDITIGWDENDNVYQIGPAEWICEGYVDVELFRVQSELRNWKGAGQTGHLEELDEGRIQISNLK